MKVRLIWPVGVLVALSTASAAYGATTIFSQTPSLDGANISDAGFAYSVYDPLYTADNFTAGVTGTATSILWRGVYFPDYVLSGSDAFTIRFYADNSGSVGSLIQAFSVGNPSSRTYIEQLTGYPDYEVYEYVADLGAGITLISGTNYWVSIANDFTIVGDGSDGWLWGVGMGAGDGSAWSLDLSSWNNASPGSNIGPPNYFFAGNQTYFVISAVPIPAAVYLFGSALGVMGWLTKRRANL